MNKFIPLLLSSWLTFTVVSGFSVTAAADNGSKSESLFDLTVRSISGEEVLLSLYRRKVLLVVNTASRCGFTPQYKDLESLYQKYRSQGFEVLGFPSNDFRGQEPGSDQEIKKFCQLEYGVTFPLFSRAPVSGEKKQPVYAYLTENTAAELRGEIKWNFEKILIDRNGKVRARFSSLTNPLSLNLTREIVTLLEEVP